MSCFVFRLRVLLDVRLRAERAARAAVAHALAAQLGAAGVVDRLRAAHAREISELREALGGSGAVGVDVRAVRMQAGSADAIRAAIARAEAGLLDAAQRCDRAREELRAATAARKSVEWLRDRQLAVWTEAQARARERALDDIAARAPSVTENVA